MKQQKKPGQLFDLKQEVTPINNTGRYKDDGMFGKTYRVAAYTYRGGLWFIQLREIPPHPCACGCGQHVIEYWDQNGFAPVGPQSAIDELVEESLQIETVCR